MTTDVSSAIQNTLVLLRELEARYDRPDNCVQLLAVSKTKPAALLLEAINAGQLHFGENYLDEALSKIEALSGKSCTWHFIGAIQSNKTATIASHFDWVHSVEREKIARRLSSQRPDEMAPLNCCIQLNIDQEASKAGILPAQLQELCASVNEQPNLVLRGLMAIPAPRKTVQEQREIFAEIAVQLHQLTALYPSLDTLSMGMSADMEAAVAEGSTMVRIGTALFGARVR